jgi:chaperonin cofactor prefoldin
MTDKTDELISELEDIRREAVSLAQQQELLEDTLRNQKQAKRLKNMSEPEKMYKQIGAGYLVETEVDEAEDEIESNIEITNERLERLERQISELKDEFSEKQDALRELVENSQ